MQSKFPQKVVERFTLYHSILIECLEEGQISVTSPQIASRLGVDDSQVRKDFKLLNNEGKCRVGYEVKGLKKSIEKALGFKKTKEAVIIGAGHVGFALAKYDNFPSYGLNIVALFDNDPTKLETKIGGKNVYHISKLKETVEELNVDIAILTVPRRFAQNTAELVQDCGIKYIWNFTPAILKVEKDVQVWNENLIASFLRFACSHMEE